MPKYKIPEKLLPPVQKKDLASQMKGLNIKPNLTIRTPSDVTRDINKKLKRINKKIKGKRMGVNDIMAKLRKMDVKVAEEKKEDKKGGKTRKKRRRRKKGGVLLLGSYAAYKYFTRKKKKKRKKSRRKR